MNYTINPGKACTKKFINEGCNINDLNDCYLETLSAYKNNYNNFVILDGVDDNWKEYMSNKMAKLPYVAGQPRTFCNFQLNRAPVFIGDHYFPSELNNNNGDANKALNSCKLKCKNVKNYNTCVENCQVDYDALVEKPIISKEMYNDGKNYIEGCSKNYQGQTYYCSTQPNGECKFTNHDEWGNCQSDCCTNSKPNQPTPTPPTSTPPTPPPTPPPPPPPPPPPKPPLTPSPRPLPISSDKPIPFYLAFSITAVLFAIAIYIFLYILIKK